MCQQQAMLSFFIASITLRGLWPNSNGFDLSGEGPVNRLKKQSKVWVPAWIKETLETK